MSEIVNGNPLDKNQSRKANVKVTKFKWVKDLFGTYRFGEIGSAFVFNGKAGDKKVRVVQGTDVESYTLKAPLMTSITMNKTYGQVPRQAILPKNWEKIFTNPSIGQDINAATYGTSIPASKLKSILAKVWENINPSTIADNIEQAIEEETYEFSLKSVIDWILRMFTLAELFFSNGNLINSQGAHIARLFKSSYGSFDKYEQWIFNLIAENIKYMQVRNTKDSGTDIIVNIGLDDPAGFGTNIIWTFKQLLEEYRDGETFTIVLVGDSEGKIENEGAQTVLNIIKEALEDFYSVYAPQIIEYNKPFDTAFAWSYQLFVAEFFTNDKVDYIYNAELYRQYVGNLYIKYSIGQGGDGNLPRFSLNGITYEADYLSQACTIPVTNLYWDMNSLADEGNDQECRAYWFAMLSYKRSLKYKDYFTGARTRPIAIGNTDVAVNDDLVQVVDIAGGIQKQRFLNVVNKIPRDIKGFTKGIFGVDVAPDWHNPLFLARVSSTIYGQEVENTGEAQITSEQSRTSVLKNAGGTISLEFSLDRNSIIIGVVDFDIPRAYSKGVNRMYMEVDRYDMNNPYLQYCGDQEVYGEEYDARKDDTFAYQGSYMHEKQDYNEAFGGFIEYLKGWTFLDQYVEKGNGDIIGDHVSPDFIRSKPSELDRFYLALSGDTLANYFHFIMKHTTKVEAVRPLAYNPQILG